MSTGGWTHRDGEETIRAYGVLNEAVQNTENEGLPHPATVIIDEDGFLRFKNV